MLNCLLHPSVACFWALLPVWAQILSVIGVGLILFGVIWSLANFFKNIGGWPAAAGAVAVAVAIIGTLFGFGARRPVAQPELVWDEKKNAPKKKRPTILDAFKKK